MELIYHNTTSNISIAELTDESFLICNAQDVLDIFGNLISVGCERVIIHERSLHPDFFDLRTRLAGEVLQKFSNYKVKVGIVGEFMKYKSKSLQDFIVESNKSNYVFFTDNFNSAILRLEKNNSGRHQ